MIPRFFLTSLCALGLVVAAHGQAESKAAQYKRFPETISPDGAYFLAWGHKLPEKADLESLVEIPYKTPLDPGKMEIQDYLAETKRSHPPLPLTKCEYFSGEEGHEKNCGLSYAWSPDSQGVLVIYESERGYLAVVWAAPLEGSVFNVGTTLEKELRASVAERFGQAEEAARPNVFFNRFAILQPGLLTIDGCLTQLSDAIEKPVTYWFRMRFRFKIVGGEMRMELIVNRLLHAVDLYWGEPARKNETAEVQLDTALAALRGVLASPEKEALKKEQALWLKQREALEIPSKRASFTSHRLEELKIRAAEAQAPDKP